MQTPDMYPTAAAIQYNRLQAQEGMNPVRIAPFNRQILHRLILTYLRRKHRNHTVPRNIPFICLLPLQLTYMRPPTRHWSRPV